MLLYRTIALAEDVAATVRHQRTSPGYGHPAHTEVATGYGPCRSCLQTFEEGVDRRILFTHDAFAGLETLPLPGPVFIHERSCERHDEDAGFPATLRSIPLTLNAYARGRKLLAQEYGRGDDVDPLLGRLLDLPELAYIHVRNSEAGCYIARIEPVETTTARTRT